MVLKARIPFSSGPDGARLSVHTTFPLPTDPLMDIWVVPGSWLLGVTNMGVQIALQHPDCISSGCPPRLESLGHMAAFKRKMGLCESTLV